MIPTEIPYFSFHSAFLVSSRRSAKRCLKSPVRSKGYKADCFFPLTASQYLAHRAAQVVVPQEPEDPSEISEGRFVRFQECLLRRSLISTMKSSSARHTPAGEDLC